MLKLQVLNAALEKYSFSFNNLKLSATFCALIFKGKIMKFMGMAIEEI